MADKKEEKKEKQEKKEVPKKGRIKLEDKEWKVDCKVKKQAPFKGAASKPTVTIFNLAGKPTKRAVAMPDVMLSPIRADLVNFVHTNMAKNNRQPYAVQNREGPHGIRAGHQVAAKSWGTGRAVSRVPRVKGGGTHRAGQGAYANMCRGGRMFNPTKVWRKWHRKINTNQKRFAVCSAVAASAVPALVMARGHRIQSVDEIPLVIEKDFSSIKKTRACLKTLQQFHLSSELRRCKRRYKRAGRGKSRNRRWKHRLGPLIVYAKNDGIVKSCRNIRGVDFCNVHCLNLLKLAPGGHVGRLIIWTEDAFRALNEVYGTNKKRSVWKAGYRPPRPVMMNSDLKRILHSQEIQSVIRAKRSRSTFEKKRNPLKNPELYAKLNPRFEQLYANVKKNYKGATGVTTTKLLKPMRKKQRLRKIRPSKEDQESMQAYWKNVFGEVPIFKSSERLAAEKEAVRKALEAQEREKAGLDLLEALQAKADGDSD